MAHPLKPLNYEVIGSVFGALTIKSIFRPPGKHVVAVCECSCGNEKNIKLPNLISGATKSCGCQRNKTHGMSRTQPYYVWRSMRDRCENPNNASYEKYGGRGIIVCDRWKKFENFYADMGERPSSDHSVDRIDNDLGYGPDNCRWATFTEQMNNTSRNNVVCFRGTNMTLTEAIRESGTEVPTRTIYQRVVDYGWDVERALTEPSDAKFRRAS